MPITRRLFMGSTGFAGASLLAGAGLGAPVRGETVALGFVGMGSRGGQLARAFSGIDGVRIAAVCDADSARAEAAAAEFGVASWTRDYQEVIDDAGVDAVVIATCNHWHCLAAIHACQAGKHVYVEKPLGHDLWQQRQLVAAARQSGRVVQVGTQQRSDPFQARARDFLHRRRGIGELHGVVACRLGTRHAIGRRQQPLPAPATVDLDRWFGPTAPSALYRERLHYDWHWDWGTGDGEMGNWGVHILDDVRHVALDDAVGLPTAVASVGGRVGWSDAGQTPNVQVSLFKTPSLPVACVTNNLAPREGAPPKQLGGVTDGYVVFGEGGRYEGRRGGGAAYDLSGRLIEQFHGDGGSPSHYRNFIDAVRREDPSALNAEVEVGHLSSAWCHFGNAAYLNGVAPDAASLEAIAGATPVWSQSIAWTRAWIERDGIAMASDPFRVCDWKEVDAAGLRLAGDATAEAQRVYRGDYRTKYAIPQIA